MAEHAVTKNVVGAELDGFVLRAVTTAQGNDAVEMSTVVTVQVPRCILEGSERELRRYLMLEGEGFGSDTGAWVWRERATLRGLF